MRTYSIYETRWGYGALVFSDRGLAGVLLPEAELEHAIDEVGRHYEQCVYRQEADNGLSSTIARYFNGEPVKFAVELDFGCVSEFTRRVFTELARVPYGTTVRYADLAEACGRPGAARAVGNAVAKNPLLVVVPCHRVVRSGGALGGWSGRPGWKERLHEIEGIGSSCRQKAEA